MGAGNQVISSTRGFSGTTGDFSDNVAIGDGSIQATASTAYDHLFMGNATWMSRSSDDNGFIYSNSFLNTGGNTIALVGSTNGLGRITMQGGVFRWHSYNGTVVAGTNYALTERFEINSSGQIDAQGVYDETTASAANVFVDTDGSLRRSTSSRRYKNSIETLTITEDQFKSLRPVSYVSKMDSLEYFGYIAEEVDSIGFTQLVTYDSNGQPDALQYGQFTAVNTAIIQKLLVRIEELEARIEALEQ